MRVLLVKTSSMGDIIHTLPALTDAARAIPGIQFDWVVENAFQEIPDWHPAVDRVIPVAVRSWRKQLISSKTWQACRTFYRSLRERDYAVVLDAQALLKSAVIARFARGVITGPDWHSARDPLSTCLYQKRVSVFRNQHAVVRMRQLFARALGYELPETEPDYGIDRAQWITKAESKKYLVFLHGTTWETKYWPEAHWRTLARLAGQGGFHVRLPWGNPAERARAERIAETGPHVEVLPRLDLAGMAKVLAGASGVVSVDTGFAHLAAALAVPAVSVYGPTSAELNGSMGPSQIHLAGQLPCAPCYGRQCTFRGEVPAVAGERLQPPCLGGVLPERVWEAMIHLSS